MASVAWKATTGLTGLQVVNNPAKHLRIIYGRVLKALQKMPADAEYRRSTEAAVLQRLELIDSEPDPAKLEEKLGGRQLEENILQAEMELNLTRTMLKYTPWDGQPEKVDASQWKWPVA